MARVAGNAESIEGIQRVGPMAGGANVIGSCELSIQCAASGVRSWGLLCEMAGRQPFPPAGEAAPAWSALFSAGRTSQQYLPRLAKARFPPGRKPRLGAEGIPRGGQRLGSRWEQDTRPESGGIPAPFREDIN